MLGWSSIQARRRWIGARIITSVLPKCLNMFVLGTNWRTRHFLGLSANLQEQSQNGLRLAADDWPDWFRTFITQMTTDNIVMWATPFSIVDWVHSKTQTLLAWSYDAKGHAEKCVERCCDWTGKKQTSVSHSFTESETFRWMLDYEWMVYLLSFYEMYSRKLFAKSQIQNPNKRETEMLINWRMWTTSPQTQILLKASLSCTSLKTTKQWSKWSKAEVQPWDTCQEPTALRLIGCSTESIQNQRSKSNMLTPKANQQTCWTHGNSPTEQWYTVSTPCLDEHNFKRGGVGSVWRCNSRCAFFNGLETTVFGSS